MTDNKVVNATVVEESTLVSPVKVNSKHLSIGKKIGVAFSVLAIACCTALSVGATDPETSQSTNNAIATTMSQSFSTVASDLGNYAMIVLPAGLGVFAITFCVRKGMSFFRTVAR